MNTNLAQCKDCGKVVSKSARTCPHCGAKKPYEGFSWLGLVVVVMIVFLLFGYFSEAAEKPGVAVMEHDLSGAGAYPVETSISSRQ